MDQKKIIRNYFRVSVRPKDRIKMTTDGQEYPIVDVGEKGVGIRLSEADIFFKTGDTVAIDLDLKGKKLQLKGKIVHVSPDASGYNLCGIKFQKLTPKSQKNLLDYLQQSREEMFSS